MWKALRSPSGVQRGIRKQEMPESVWARTRKASHIGAEQNHLWPTSSYSAPGPPPFSGVAVVVLARTSEPPCFSVIAIPQSEPRLRVGRHRALVVVEREEAGLPLLGQLGLLAQRRDRRVGHRDRAADPALGLHQQHELGGAGDVGAGPGLAPGRGVQAVADADPHQLVPGGVELDLVDAVAVAVVGAQLGLVLVGLGAPADRLPRAADRAQLARFALGPLGALAPQRLDQRPVGVEGVVVLQRRGLVEDLVGARWRSTVAIVRLCARPWPSPPRIVAASIASPRRWREDQSREPDRRARRRRDDPDHLGVHQRAADPSLPRPRPRLLRPRDREPRRDRRPDHGRRGRMRSRSTASASSARRSPPTRPGSRSSA